MEKTRAIAGTLLDRFWEKVRIGGNDDCWEWIGSKGKNGYGNIRPGSRKHGVISAHTLSFILGLIYLTPANENDD